MDAQSSAVGSGSGTAKRVRFTGYPLWSLRSCLPPNDQLAHQSLPFVIGRELEVDDLFVHRAAAEVADQQRGDKSRAVWIDLIDGVHVHADSIAHVGRASQTDFLVPE